MIPAQWSSVPDWMRRVAGEVNPRISGYPFPAYSAAPNAPSEGFTYYDTALKKVRTFDGTLWNNHW